MERASALPAPEWINAKPAEWPPEIRRAYTLMAKIAMRRLDKEKAAAQVDMPAVADEASGQTMGGRLGEWLSEGVRTAHRLDARLAAHFGLSVSKATAIRKELGFVPAYKGGPIIAPQEV